MLRLNEGGEDGSPKGLKHHTFQMNLVWVFRQSRPLPTPSRRFYFSSRWPLLGCALFATSGISSLSFPTFSPVLSPLQAAIRPPEGWYHWGGTNAHPLQTAIRESWYHWLGETGRSLSTGTPSEQGNHSVKISLHYSHCRDQVQSAIVSCKGEAYSTYSPVVLVLSRVVGSGGESCAVGPSWPLLFTHSLS